jgi:hypothetical protein
MGNVVAANFYPNYNYTYTSSLGSNTFQNFNSHGDAHQIMWKLSRAMKAAGWVHKGSSDGYAGSPGNVSPHMIFPNDATPENDLWNGYGDIIQTGNTACYSSQYGSAPGCFTITGLSGLTTASVGRILMISGGRSDTTTIVSNTLGYDNNGQFRIVRYIDATSCVIYNLRGIADASRTNLIWAERDKLATVPGQTGSAASIGIGAFDGQRILQVTGLTGMTPLSTNRFLTLSGTTQTGNSGTFKILKYISSSSVTVINPSGVSNDGSSGAIIWKETDPLLETYPHLFYKSWILMQGPSTLKISISGASTGTFIRGENITQTTTGAQGELLGYHFDSVTSVKYLVVMPRFQGTGATSGWSNSDTITGGISGATVTPTAVLEYARECVFYLNGNYLAGGAAGYTSTEQGSAAIQCIETSGESSYRFSVKAGGADCTAAIAPGHGTSTNIFPTVGSYTWMGNGTVIGTGSGSGYGCDFFANHNLEGVFLGYCHFMCADATWDIGRSADGSFACAASATAYNHNNGNNLQYNSSSYIGFVWTRCDEQEDGDIDPYVLWMPLRGDISSTSASPLYTTNITATLNFNPLVSPNYGGWGTNTFGSNTFPTATDLFTISVQPYNQGFGPGGSPRNEFVSTFNFLLGGSTPAQYHQCKGWRRRGLGGTNDNFQAFGVAVIGYAPTSGNFTSNATGFLGQYTMDEPYLANKSNGTVINPVWIVSAQTPSSTAGKMRKGVARWMKLVGIGQAGDLYDSGKFIQLSSSSPAYIVGPWDGFSVPVK